MLGLAVAEDLFRRFPRADIGRLTKVHGQAVSGRACVEVAEALGLPEMLREAAPSDPEGGIDPEALLASERALASVCEAMIGACYLHHGFEATAEATAAAFAEQIELASETMLDFKSALQELLAREGARVTYEVVREAGPPHDRRFEVAAVCDGAGDRQGGGAEQEGRRAGRCGGGAGAPRAVGSRPEATKQNTVRSDSEPSQARAADSMHLSSITIKGFKSFPERTRLVFSPGVSVIVGPNGCGKSNITDAVLWALGEQSPLTVRGQTMQDMIFAGGEEQSPRRYAEVEVVLETSQPAASSLSETVRRGGGSAAGSEFSEISIRRRLERNGEGEYRLNGARCRLVDVIEVLADANLGREMHSVISQGRVEEIVHSKPRDRRLLVEEAAGLGKHRKRRRRAQLKLERTQENLDRALDVEREARSRLRPLKRQAQAADIQARFEREAGELRARLSGGRAPRAVERARRRRARCRPGRARSDRRVEAEQAKVGRRRSEIEERLAERDRERTAVWGRLTALRAAHERLSVRGEALAGRRAELAAELERRRAALGALADECPPTGGAGDDPVASGLERISSALAGGERGPRARPRRGERERAGDRGGAGPRGVRAGGQRGAARRGAAGPAPAGLAGGAASRRDASSWGGWTRCSRRRPRRGTRSVSTPRRSSAACSTSATPTT